MISARARILHHLLGTEARNDPSTRESAVTALYEEKLIEAYEAGISRAPYKLTAAGKAEAIKTGKPETDAAALRAYFLASVLAASGKKQTGPWFHDIEHESMLEDGLLEVSDSGKRYAPFRLTAKGQKACEP